MPIPLFGYEGHISVDRHYGFIRAAAVTLATGKSSNLINLAAVLVADSRKSKTEPFIRPLLAAAILVEDQTRGRVSFIIVSTRPSGSCGCRQVSTNSKSYPVSSAVERMCSLV